ncbi:MAG TPA: sn-glycerol-1-phosphate dehydrogenase [Bryobacteraceae bacterium]|nr:sn-glycerol-1-phosphate dehydrogenase [Bryobacteraceae bacterium]
MSDLNSPQEEQLLKEALAAARDTRLLDAGPGARHRAAAVFAALFGSGRAVIVADENTFEAAGRDVHDSFASTRHSCAEPFIFDRSVYASTPHVDALYDALKDSNATPVAVGSGTINDLTKLVAHRLGRPYMVVATAASMDGYTAYGASITHQGSKQTFDCPAPQGVLADLDVIAKAPAGMNASGYADLLAKCAAGGDWIVADEAGVEPIDPPSWNAVQGLLRTWLASPGGIARNHPDCLRHLVHGLLMSGFAMQALRSSRPASGAEHQFSHLWDMQHHTAPSHGFKVGIGTLASLALYEDLLARDAADFDIESAVERWPSCEGADERIAAMFGTGDLASTACREMRAKHATPEALRDQLTRLRTNWPRLQARLREHLLPFAEAREMLREAGCPFEPEQIGIPRERLRLSYQQAYFIRRRFTVLDLAERWGLMHPALDSIFSTGGRWPMAMAEGTDR